MGMVVDECPVVDCLSPMYPYDWMETGRLIVDLDMNELTDSTRCFY